MRSNEALGLQLGQVISLLRLQSQLIGAALLLLTFFVPVAAVTTEGDSGGSEVERFRGFGLAVQLPEFAEDLEDLVENHPYAAPGGLWLTGIGLAVLAAGLVVGAAALVYAMDSESRRATWIVRIGVGLLIIGALLIAIGLGWYPDGDLDEGEAEVGPAAGLWIPVAAAVWIGAIRSKLAGL